MQGARVARGWVGAWPVPVVVVRWVGGRAGGCVANASGHKGGCVGGGVRPNCHGVGAHAGWWPFKAWGFSSSPASSPGASLCRLCPALSALPSPPGRRCTHDAHHAMPSPPSPPPPLLPGRPSLCSADEVVVMPGEDLAERAKAVTVRWARGGGRGYQPVLALHAIT